MKPELLVCDEAVAALDVSIQAQVLNLFMQLRADFNLTYLFISHDLGVVEHLSDRVVIMYLGRVVETAPAPELFRHANHPYTQALLAEVPTLDKRHRDFAPIKGEIPSPLDPPSGCHFHPRCPHAMERCRSEQPRLREITPGHWSACHLNDQLLIYEAKNGVPVKGRQGLEGNSLQDLQLAYRDVDFATNHHLTQRETIGNALLLRLSRDRILKGDPHEPGP